MLFRSYGVGLLLRENQDLLDQLRERDKVLVSAMSQSKQNPMQLDMLRRQIREIEVKQKSIQARLENEFPDFAALSNPRPLAAMETQKLLASDEALVFFLTTQNETHVFVVSKEALVWRSLPVNARDLYSSVTQLRQSLTFQVDKTFDSALAYKIYQQTFGPIANNIASKKRISIVANGALTSLPFGLLVTQDPSGKNLKDVDWLIKSHAITIIPSVFSLKTMRKYAGAATVQNPMIAFADPVFSKAAQAQAKSKQKVVMPSITSLYQGAQLDIGRLRETLLQLDGTRGEVQAIGKTLGASADDLKLGNAATEIGRAHV